MKFVLLLSAALAASVIPASAQSERGEDMFGELPVPVDREMVVVSATRIPTPVSQVASSVTVITAADIEARQLRSLPDVLRSVPGVNIVQSGGAGGQTS